MDFKTFFVRKVLMAFFVSVTCICTGMAILGMLFEPDMQFGYLTLLSPLIYGAATMLPVAISYSKHELSVRALLVRNLMQLILIELIVFLIIFISGSLSSFSLAISVALSVLLIYIVVFIVLWVNDRKTAKEFNEALRKMQQDQ